MTSPVPPAPWRLRGDAAAFLASPCSVRLLVRYAQSPVGPYEEHALATLTRRGPHVFEMSVNLLDSMIGGRTIWGFPKTLETLSWQRRGPRILFRREDQTFRVRGVGPAFPLSLAFWTAQRKDDEWVRVPGQIQGRARFGFRGRQLALILEGFDLLIEPPA